MFSDAAQKQEAFLNKLAGKLNYQRHSLAEEPFQPENKINLQKLQGLSQDELLEVAKEQSDAIYTDFKVISKENLAATIQDILEEKGQGNYIIPDDSRFAEYQLTDLANHPNTYTWKKGAEFREENLNAANQANVGIAFAEYLLAESATVVFETNAGHGRTLQFLPQHFVAIVPKSQIVPRITQATADYNEKVLRGEKIGSNLSFISGPSNSGDIEMILVVGVHGPLSMTYLILEDA